MQNVINLNRFRKKQKCTDEEKRAEENRVKFGRTKEQRKSDAIADSKAANHLDGHKLDKEKPSP